LSSAVEKMRGKKTGCVLVMAGGKLLGLLSERELLRRSVEKTDWDKAKVESLMRETTNYLREEDSVADAFTKWPSAATAPADQARGRFLRRHQRARSAALPLPVKSPAMNDPRSEAEALIKSVSEKSPEPFSAGWKAWSRRGPSSARSTGPRQLYYLGYPIEELAAGSTFEEHLSMWHGRLPRQAELDASKTS